MHLRKLITGIISLLEITPDQRPEAVKNLFKQSEIPLHTFASVYYQAVNFYIQLIQTKAKERGCDPDGIGIVRTDVTGTFGPNLYGPDFAALLFALRPLLEAEQVKETIISPN